MENIYAKAIEHYGTIPQIMMVCEECAELIQAINKMFRNEVNSKTVDKVSEEVADVEIVLEQLKIILMNGKEVEDWRKYKLKRLAERIENDNNEE